MPFEVSHQWFVRLWTTSYELESSKIICHKGFYFSKFKIHELYNWRFTTLAQFYFYLLDLDRLDVRWPPPPVSSTFITLFARSFVLLVCFWFLLDRCCRVVFQPFISIVWTNLVCWVRFRGWESQLSWNPLSKSCFTSAFTKTTRRLLQIVPLHGFAVERKWAKKHNLVHARFALPTHTVAVRLACLPLAVQIHLLQLRVPLLQFRLFLLLPASKCLFNKVVYPKYRLSRWPSSTASFRLSLWQMCCSWWSDNNLLCLFV